MTNKEDIKLCYEDGVIIPEKYSIDNTLIEYAKEGKIKIVKDLLERGVSAKALLTALDAALAKDKWKTAMIFFDYCNNKDIETYTECIKKMFLKASYTGDIEKVKFFLEKLIENAVGVLADETGRNTLKIALENNPADIVKILENYGFHENSLRHAFNCILDVKKNENNRRTHNKQFARIERDCPRK
jgi:hypothetical protein